MIKRLVCLLSLLVLWCTQVTSQVIARDDWFIILEDQETVFNVQLNDMFDDPTCQGQMGVSIRYSTGNAEVSVEDGTQIRYQPRPNFYGVDSFIYRVSSCILGSDMYDDAMVRINVLPTNDPPVVESESLELLEDQHIVIDVQANDFDPDNYKLITIPHPEGASHGTGYVISNDSIYYQPDSNYFGIDTFKYIICDNALGSTESLCDTGLVELNVLPVGDPLYVIDDSLYFSIPEDTEWCQQLDSFVIDVDREKDALTYKEMTDQLEWERKGDTAIACFMPEKDFNGTLEFEVEVCDPDDNCTKLNIFLSVEPVYDSIKIQHNPLVIQTEEEESVCFPLDSLVFNPDGSTLETQFEPSDKQIGITQDTLCYTPDGNFFGQDTFELEICDSLLCEYATVVVEVSGTDDPLIAINDTFLINEKKTYFFPVTENDLNPDKTDLQVRLVTQDDHLRIDDNKVRYSIQYGIELDTFQYEISNSLYKDTATVYVQYEQIFKELQLQDDQVFIKAGETLTVNLFENDIIPQEAISFDFIDEPDWVSGFPKECLLSPQQPVEVDFYYSVCMDLDNHCDTAKVSIAVSNTSEIIVYPVIPNSFSPNEDGVNDVFHIENNGLLAEQELIIFDRWGDVVYKMFPYDNSWDGTHYKIKDPLIEGVYYYTYRALIEGEIQLYSGYLVLKR